MRIYIICLGYCYVFRVEYMCMCLYVCAYAMYLGFCNVLLDSYMSTDQYIYIYTI